MTRATRDHAARLRHEIIRIAQAGVDVSTLRRRVLPLLRKVLVVDAVWWALADPETLLFSQALTDDIPSVAVPLFLENEISQPDVNKFRALARGPEPVATLYSATRQAPEDSVRYRDILRPHRLGDEMRVALRDRKQTWGFMCLHREAGARAFSPDEQKWMRQLAPHLAAGLRQSLLLAGGSKHPLSEWAAGVLVLSDEGEGISVTPAAERLLRDLPDWSERPTRVLAIQSVISRLRALEQWPGEQLPPPRVRVRTLEGRWVTISASRLSTSSVDNSIAIVVEPTRFEDLVPLRLAASGLTATEINIAAMTVQGLSNQEIAQALGNTRLTVQQHLKSIFDKTGTHSRGELIGRLSRR